MSSSPILLILFLNLLGHALVQPAKILIIPFGIYSHINIHTKLGAALRHDGHDVWLLAFDEYRDDIIKRDIHPITFPLKRDDDYFGQMYQWTLEGMDAGEVVVKYFSSDHWKRSYGRICDAVLGDDVIMSTIADLHLDLVIMDGCIWHLCMLMIPYRLEVPFISVHSFQFTAWITGLTGLPSIEPEFARDHTNRMDFWQRVENLHGWLDRYYDIHYDIFSHHMDKYCPPHKPKIPLWEVERQSEMYLMNYEIMCLDYPRVSAPHVQYLGGSTATPPQPLPEDLETYITEAEHGVVLMSMGSMKLSQTVWPVMGEKLFTAFDRLPQRVLVQYGLDTIYGTVPPNVKLMTWLPQNDILAHSNIKLFITHGGNNGQNEAIFNGVPMLVIPIQFDQIYTGKRVEFKGYGKLVLNKKAVTSEELYGMMREILTNQTYSDKTKKCSAIVRSMPSAQEKFVFWVNHILQFGGAHLRPPSLDMPLYQVLMLDILAYYVIMALATFHASIFLLYFIIKFLRRNCKAKRD